MRERGRGSGEDRQGRVEVLGTVLIVRRARVHGLEIPLEDGGPLLHADDVLLDAAWQKPVDLPEDYAAAVPRSRRTRRDESVRRVMLPSAAAAVAAGATAARA